MYQITKSIVNTKIESPFEEKGWTIKAKKIQKSKNISKANGKISRSPMMGTNVNSTQVLDSKMIKKGRKIISGVKGILGRKR